MQQRVRFGYRSVAEQYTATELLEFVALAERQGFEFSMISDHFHPWFHKGGHAAFAWVWLASAAERTKTIQLGTGVTTPINRYHPAIVAQAFATAASVYPGRILLGLGTGEAMNEVPVGQRWPPFKERVERVRESIEIIRMLWSSSFASYKGRYFSIQDANLYERPPMPIPMYVAASGSTMAEMAGRHGDGIYTTPAPEEKIRNVILPALERGAEKAGRSPENIDRMILCNVSWDEDYDKALQSILRWRVVAAPDSFGQHVWDPRELDKIGERVAAKDLAWRWTICTNLEDVIEKIEGYIRMGFNEIEIRSGSPDERAFIQKFGKEILPYLREKYGSTRR